MSSNSFDIDAFLSDVGIPIEGSESINPEGTIGLVSSYKEPGYEGEIDYRIRQLSYSSMLSLHQCPRKFELYKKRTTHRTEELEQSTITYAFGHVVGLGIQLVLEGAPKETIIWKMFLEWHTASLFASDDRSHKNIFYAILAIKRFIDLREQGLLANYELVYFEGKPATELSFCITLPDGFRYRGFVDAVLQHTVTQEIVVLEVKTTNSTSINAATYKNSAQAIGYSIVLDVIFPELSSYKVIYGVYQTKSKEYTLIPFVKTYLQRAQWIREVLLDVDMIKLYEAAEVYPMHGESCFNFGRECEYINTCTLSTQYLTKPCTEKEADNTKYQVNLSILDLVTTQLEKVGTQNDTSIILD